ncbi:MAG TPA: murein biosynthesis integral membrane protein MurJ [Dehalococcoidia bacterium]|nr:murein biosynthesis integral membrane protein MurJ [Dehalococcoidia bacterium]
MRQERAIGAGGGLAAAAAIVAIGFLGSRLLGLLRTVAIANGFGTSPELGAYWVAFRLPDMIFQLLAGATLASAFIPVFSRYFARQSREEAWRLASSVLNLVFIATAVLALLGLLLAPLLVPLMAPGLGEDSGRQAELQALAVRLTRIMLISPLFFSVSGMFMGISNARHHFLFPALAPWTYNLSIIVAALVSNSVEGLAVGVVAGSFIHMAIQLPAVRFIGMLWKPLADWRDPGVREVGRLMLPRALGLAAAQFNFLVTIFFASQVSDEAISAVNYAWLIVMMPLGLFGMAISTAVFPTLAEQAAAESMDALRRTLSVSLRLILFLTLPASVGLMILGKPLVTFLFEHGAFTASSTDVTAAALVFYAIGLFAQGGIEILSRGFYALSDTRTPVTFAVVAMVANLVLCLIFVGPLGVRGLGLALSLSAILEFSLLFRALRVRIVGLEEDRLVSSVTKAAAATIVMAEVVGLIMLILHASGHLNTGNLGDAFFALFGGAVVGAGAFFAVSWFLGSEEMEVLRRRLPMLHPSAVAEGSSGA